MFQNLIYIQFWLQLQLNEVQLSFAVYFATVHIQTIRVDNQSVLKR